LPGRLFDILSISSRQQSESLRPSLTEAKGTEAQECVGDGTSASSVEQKNCGPRHKNRLRARQGRTSGPMAAKSLRSKPGSVELAVVQRLVLSSRSAVPCPCHTARALCVRPSTASKPYGLFQRVCPAIRDKRGRPFLKQSAPRKDGACSAAYAGWAPP